MRNSTIIPKKKRLSCGHFDFNFSKGRCKACATVASTNKRWEAHEDQEEGETLQTLTEDLDRIYSRYIRLKYMDPKTGLVPCYTCSAKLPMSQIQNGHYIHREDKGLRFLDDNCRPQCPTCNTRHNDDKEPYKSRLEKEKPGITEWLEEQARLVAKPTRTDLKELLVHYRFKVKLLESGRKKNTQ
jgi:hypothetical protein